MQYFSALKGVQDFLRMLLQFYGNLVVHFTILLPSNPALLLFKQVKILINKSEAISKNQGCWV